MKRDGQKREFGKVVGSIPRAFGLVWSAERPLTIVMIALFGVSSFMPPAVAWITKLVVDQVVEHVQTPTAGGVGMLAVPLVMLAVVWVAQKLIGIINAPLIRLLQFRVEQHTANLIMTKCGEFDLAYFENPTNLNKVEAALSGAMMSAYSLINQLFSLFGSIITLATFLAILSQLHWSAPLIVIASTAPQMVSSGIFARRRWDMVTNRAEDSRLREYVARIMVDRQAAKEVRVLGLLETMLERYKSLWQKFYEQEGGHVRRQAQTDGVLSIISSIGAISIWILVALFALDGRVSVGDIFLFTQAVTQSQNFLIIIFNRGGTFYEQSLFLRNLFEVLDTDPESVEGALAWPAARNRRWGDRKVPDRLLTGLELRNVSFHYPGSDRLILKDLSFRVHESESVAIVGKNGAGKTTLAKLLVRLYDPTEGAILLDGVDIREYEIGSLREAFGIVFQDYFKYSLTIRENIGFGQVSLVNDIGRVSDAARQAELHSFIDGLPDGYETYLGKQFMGRGVDLSGGEWQRVALSRAYIRDSPIVILDEPTASLDAFAEAEVYRTFGEKTEGRIFISVSHRFSTVRAAEHIIVIDDGAVVEEGDHAALIAHGGLYARMFRTQASRYTD